ncbi:hypothetical protein [Natronorubrum sp. DTA7]|uniref:hypothetical protein n=1 Tax=Natronorubrum sp. DTA7 TaxID=3447016 RepID=UPI003F85BBFB
MTETPGVALLDAVREALEEHGTVVLECNAIRSRAYDSHELLSVSSGATATRPAFAP